MYTRYGKIKYPLRYQSHVGVTDLRVVAPSLFSQALLKVKGRVSHRCLLWSAGRVLVHPEPLQS